MKRALVESVGPGLIPRPAHTMYLSGVVCPGLLEASARGDVGLLIQPDTAQYVRHIGSFGVFGVDNGCFAKGDAFDAQRWFSWVTTLPREGCAFVVAPDVVGDAGATWRRSRPWLERIREAGFPAALVAQNGLTARDTEVIFEEADAVFIGGDDAFKVSPFSTWLVGEARAAGKWTHVGRVNSRRRMRWAGLVAGADSADGTYLAFGPKTNLPKLLSWLDELKRYEGVPPLPGMAGPVGAGVAA